MKQMTDIRAGSYTNFAGTRCFRPGTLPPELELTPGLHLLLSQADRALARLDGASMTVPDPDLFIYAFMRQEAALSSQIEGTEASLDDLFEQEAVVKPNKRANDVEDIVNYVRAMNWGLTELENIPLSLRLIRGMHKQLLATGRGAGRNPGNFRDGQNHIGPPGCTIEEATFVPPAVPLMREALSQWEQFLHDRSLPPLIRAAFVHAQFETIHPFWDGNGRIGRMLITLMLVEEEILTQPLLYLSIFLKAHRSEYYERLQATRDEGDWQGWVTFFLTGVRETSKIALISAQRILRLREATLTEAQNLAQSANYGRLADFLFRSPIVSANSVAATLDVSHQAASNIIKRFTQAGILVPRPRRGRDRHYAFQAYLDILYEEIAPGLNQPSP